MTDTLSILNQGTAPARPARPSFWTRVRRGLRDPEPALRRLGALQAVVSAADAAFTVSMAGSLFFGVSVDAARPRILAYLLLTIAPFAVVASLVGPLLDRVKGGHRAVLIGASALRVLACVVVVFSLDTVVFFPAAFAVLVLGKTTTITRSALVPRLLRDPEHLVLANARIARVAAIGGLVGGAAAGSLLKLTSAPVVASAAAATYLLAALVATRIRPAAAPVVPSGMAELAELVGPRLRLAAGAMSVMRFVVGFMTFHIAFVFKSSRQPLWAYGLVLAAGSASGFAGASVGPWLRRRFGEAGLLGAALTTVAVAGAIASSQRPPAGAVLFVSAVTLAASVAQHAFAATVQRLAPDAELGRAFARFGAQFQIVWVLGAVGPVLVRPPRTAGFVLLAAVAGAATVVYRTVERRAQRRERAPAEAATADPAGGLLAVAHGLAAQGERELAVLTAVEAVRVHLARVRAGAPLPAAVQKAWLHVAHGDAADDQLVSDTLSAADRVVGISPVPAPADHVAADRAADPADGRAGPADGRTGLTVTPAVSP